MLTAFSVPSNAVILSSSSLQFGFVNRCKYFFLLSRKSHALLRIIEDKLEVEHSVCYAPVRRLAVCNLIASVSNFHEDRLYSMQDQAECDGTFYKAAADVVYR